MTTSTISMWGNSNAMRIPLKIMQEAGLSTGDTVTIEISTDNNKIIITPTKTESNKVSAAGILHRYAKNTVDQMLEKEAIAKGIAEKYAKTY